ncbi:Yae1p NDAI_0A03950 [Naumovozyma dairenensis CBS 421]|uniref:Protein YAE1 n=1 Tax=Naumovozyma dairenensis (strain ATCC 10597 / BCRC 20456 / CBS 421 / NBRC 0211 / NRRL Y-12639) TaxID=1071378 RepID=G0W414_NAUDC|nr:hypothetical protein NDAI_0A03950 [Naumovozyma dairenensis CBS 421]CCD22552.1 hypothetical protein NDAI_0A03950 [Naumovozyma dairenensis CBS 421]
MADFLDDVFEPDTSPDAGREMSLDLMKVRDAHNKRGYLDGIVSSKEVNLQQGFNAGFPTGALLGVRVGNIIGRLQGLDYMYGSIDDELREKYKMAQKELKINNVLSKSSFDPDFELKDEKHQRVDEWEKITKQFLEKYNVNTKKSDDK